MKSLMEVMLGVEKNGHTRSKTLLMKEVDKSIDDAIEQLYTTGHLLDFLLAQLIHWARLRNEDDKGERLYLALRVLDARIDEKRLDRIWQVLEEVEHTANAEAAAGVRFELSAEELLEYCAELSGEQHDHARLQQPLRSS
jgi:hypothetical protein